MATEQQCEAALTALHSLVEGVGGVQGVGINESDGEHYLVIYVEKPEPAHRLLPDRFVPAGDTSGEDGIPVQVVSIGSLSPL